MFSLNRQFINFEDRLLEVRRKFREEHIKDIELVKQYYDCDITLRQDEFLYFCVEVPEAEIVTEDDMPRPVKTKSKRKRKKI